MSKPRRGDHQHRPTWLGNLISNWETYEASVGRKLGLAARNLTWGRLRHGVCCGHHGQPGC